MSTDNVVDPQKSIGQLVQIDYTNWRGERSVRLVKPLNIFWGSNEWHFEVQWLMTGYDMERGGIRVYAMKDIHGWKPGPPPNPTTIIPKGGSCEWQ